MTTTNPSIVADIFTSAFEVEEGRSFIEEVGTLVFQSALMRYYAEHEEDTVAFDSFVESHVAHESFMEELCAEYPEFESLLVSEMQAFSKSVETLRN
jgi:hypothetical protein